MAQTKINWDYTNVSFAGLLSQAIRKIPELSRKWTNLAPSDPGMAIVEVLAHLTDVLKRYDDFSVQNLSIQDATLLKQIQNFALFAGTSVRPKTSATVVLKFTLKNTAPIPSLIPEGTGVKTEDGIIFETNEDLYIGPSRVGTVLASEGETVSDVIIGGSDESAFQRFRIPTDSLVYNQDEYSITVQVREGGVWITWKYIKNLVDAEAMDRKFSIEVSDFGFFLLFGDNQTGLIPRLGTDNIQATYRVGGGERGLVSEDTITTLVNNDVADIVDSVTNEDRSYGGLERESIDQARNRIPALIKTNLRAIAPLDFKAIAERLDGVAIARSFAIAQSIFLFVVPSTGGELTNDLATTILTHFNSKKQQGYVVNIQSATYKTVGLKISIKSKRGYDGSTVMNAVQENLVSLLSPVAEPSKIIVDRPIFFLNDFGADLHIDSIYTIVRETEGVEYGNIDEMTVDDAVVPIADIYVDDFEIIKDGTIEISIVDQLGAEFTTIYDPLTQNALL